MAKKVTTKRTTASRKPIAGTRPKAPATSKGTGVSKSLVNKSRTVTGSTGSIHNSKTKTASNKSVTTTKSNTYNRATSKPLAGQMKPSSGASKVSASRASGLVNQKSSVTTRANIGTAKKKIY